MSAIRLAAAVVLHEGKILVVKRSGRERFLPGNWGIPCGKVDIEDGEKPEHAALRELLEETGLRAEIICFAGKSRFHSTWRGRRKRNIQRNYLVKPISESIAKTSTVHQSTDHGKLKYGPKVILPEKDQDYKWVPQGALAGLKPNESVPILNVRLDAHNLGAIRQGLIAWHIPGSWRRRLLPASLLCLQFASMGAYRRTNKVVSDATGSPAALNTRREMARSGGQVY